MLPVAKGVPVSESLLWAANELTDPEITLDRATHAVRDATLSIEFHLDTLTRELGPARMEPRLVGHARAIEAALREALLDAWRAEADMREGVLPLHRLERLSRKLRHITEDEVDLVFEELREVTAAD